MLVPYYDNKKSNIYTYANNPYLRIDLSVFLNVLSDDILATFGEYDGLTADGLEKIKKKAKYQKLPPIGIGDRFVSFDEFIINAKLFFPTGWTCDYGLWEIGSGFHNGIDLVMPKGTPIESFFDGQVFRVIDYDKENTDYGNCVVIKTHINNDTIYICYYHLDSINVTLNQKVKKGDIIGTCGNTGNSKGYHLHFQIDKEAAFHPFYSKNLDDIRKYTLNPWTFLRNEFLNKNLTNGENNEKNLNDGGDVFNKNEIIENNDILTNVLDSLIKDKPVNKNYIDFFVNAGIIKGDNGDLKLDSPLTRYQFALILYRLSKLIFKLKEKDCDINYKDIDNTDVEFKKALKLLKCNNILKGDKDFFYPWKFLTGEQFLVVLGRLFGVKNNGTENSWSGSYINWAKREKLIPENWQYLYKPLPRKEVLNILGKKIFNTL